MSSYCAWDSMDFSPPGSSVHGISQARELEWVPFPSPEDLPSPVIKLRSPALQVNSLPTELPGKPIYQLLCSHWIMSDSLWSHGLQYTRLPCPSLSSGVCSNSCPLSQWCYSTISSSVTSFSSFPQSFPASESFPMSWLITSGGQIIRASVSASALLMNIQDWFPLELTGLISLLSKGLLKVFSSITVQKQFFGSQPSLGFPVAQLIKESTCNAGDPSLIPESGRSTGEGIDYPLWYSWASLMAQLVKNLPAMWETWVWSLGWEDPLEEGMATHSSILAWRIPMDRGP